MGFSSDIMHDFVTKEIRAVFSSYDGWNATQRPIEGGYDTLVTLDRRNGGHRESMRVLVTFAPEVSASLIDELKKTDRTSDGTITRYGFGVMVPANTDTSAVPPGFLIYTMASFAQEGKNLIWLKKPVQKAEPPKVAS